MCTTSALPVCAASLRNLVRNAGYLFGSRAQRLDAQCLIAAISTPKSLTEAALFVLTIDGLRRERSERQHNGSEWL